MDTQRESGGLVVVDARGQHLFSSGLGANPVVQDELQKVATPGSPQSRQSHTVSANGEVLSVISVRCGNETVFCIARNGHHHELPDPEGETDIRIAVHPEPATVRCAPVSYGLEHIVGASEAIQELKKAVVKVAPLDVPVLLCGESGTGKELVARAIHALSPRHQQPLVVVNAAALPASLVESEMFGYEPGSFTGADRKGRRGKFEQADQGTLFLDEIGDMPLDMQVKLLRVLQDGVFERVGGDRNRHSNFRLICATNRELKQQVNAEKFRLDLYYRISGVTLRIPPLRDRLEDIPVLVDHFLAECARRHQRSITGVHQDVCAFLHAQPWPGNVRQLLHEVEKAAIFCDRGELQVSDFLRTADRAEDLASGGRQHRGTIPAALETVELELIRAALIRHKGNKSRVASELGISRSYLYKKLDALSGQA